MGGGKYLIHPQPSFIHVPELAEKNIKKKPRATYGWVVFTVSVLFVFYKYILEVSPSIMTKHFMLEFNIDAAIVGHIAASYYYAYTIMQIPGGLLVDAFGPRIVATASLICCSFGALVFGASQHLTLTVVSRFCMGIGGSVAILNTFKIISNWFPSRRFAFLAGLTLTLGTLGAAFGQAPLSHLITFIGWRQSFFDLALFGFLLTALFFLLIRNKPKHVVYDVIPKTRTEVKLSHALLHIMRSKQTWLLSFYSGLAFTPILSFAGLWGVSFIETKYQLERTHASFLISLVFVGFAIGAPLFGWYSSHIGKRKPVMLWGTFSAFCLLTLAIYLPPISISLYAILTLLIGLSLSAFLLSFSVIHEINVPLMTATAIGLMNTFNSLIGALTDPLIGFFIDLIHKFKEQPSLLASPLVDYHLSLAILPFYLFICLILLRFVKESHCTQTTAIEGDIR